MSSRVAFLMLLLLVVVVAVWRRRRAQFRSLLVHDLPQREQPFDVVQVASEQSFPASDAPGWILERI